FLGKGVVTVDIVGMAREIKPAIAQWASDLEQLAFASERQKVENNLKSLARRVHVELGLPVIGGVTFYALASSGHLRLDGVMGSIDDT
ncbi:MAG: hypothetical protein ACRDGA_01195, partial [Bacteroidota bacterium]